MGEIDIEQLKHDIEQAKKLQGILEQLGVQNPNGVMELLILLGIHGLRMDIGGMRSELRGMRDELRGMRDELRDFRNENRIWFSIILAVLIGIGLKLLAL